VRDFSPPARRCFGVRIETLACGIGERH